MLHCDDYSELLRCMQVVLLDECSQMTEPMSLLPVARFNCSKLVVVGDPKVCLASLYSGYVTPRAVVTSNKATTSIGCVFHKTVLGSTEASFVHITRRLYVTITFIAKLWSATYPI